MHQCDIVKAVEFWGSKPQFAVVNREYHGIVVSKHEAYLINTNERSQESSRELVQVQDTNRASVAINSSSEVNLK